MKRVLVLTNSIDGLFCFRKEVVQAYLDMGCEVFISCPIQIGLPKLQAFVDMGCEIIETEFNRKGTNPIADLRLMLKYRRIIKRISPDLVLSYTIKPNLYGGMACAVWGVPQLANVTGLGAAVEYPGILRLLTINLYRIGLKKTKTIFFQNEDNLHFFLRHKIVRGRYRLIPGSGVNLSYHSFVPYPSDRESIRFIFIARIRKEKGIEEYLYAAKVIQSLFPNTEFHIVGNCEDDYFGQISEMQKCGVVIYHGYQEDVRPLLANIHCTIHPTFYPEGMSNVLLESCAAGRPVITTNRAGCKEIVDDGVNGFLINQQDKLDLVEKVKKFIALPYEEKRQMGLNARKKVEKEFDRKIVIKAYMEESDQYV